MMLVPRKSSFDLWDEMFKDPFFSKEIRSMKTDIKENKDNYTFLIDLPGYSKEDIKINIENGYLTIEASKDVSKDEKDKEKDSYIKRERYYEDCSRSFYLGENFETEDVKASYKNGTLTLTIPKKEKEELPEKKYVEIEG